MLGYLHIICVDAKVVVGFTQSEVGAVDERFSPIQEKKNIKLGNG